MESDVHDSSDKTFSQYTVPPGEGATTTHGIIIMLIIMSVLLETLALYVAPTEMYLDEDMTVWDRMTFFEKSVDCGLGYIIIFSTTVTSIVAFVVPQYLGAVYFVISICSSTLNEYGVGGVSVAIGALTFVVSLVIEYYVYKYRKETGSGRPLFIRIWFGKA